MQGLILVIEDEPDLAATLEYNLQKEGYATRVALTEGWVELSADLIDTSAERERLTKQHGELEATLTRAAKKLANEGFLAKAAPEVVAHEREKHDRLVSQLAEVDAQLAELG